MEWVADEVVATILWLGFLFVCKFGAEICLDGSSGRSQSSFFSNVVT